MKPREERFFELLRQHSALCAEAGNVFYRSFSDELSCEDGYEEVRNIKREARKSMADLRERLFRTFKEPADIEDMREFIQKLDFTVNQVKDLLNSLCMYRAEDPPAGMYTMAELVYCSLEEMKKIIAYTEDIPGNYLKMEARCRKVGAYERRGDLCYREEMSLFFRTRKDPLYVIQWKDIMTDTEHVLDTCAGMVPLFQKIVTKYME